jgi:hypothetical protein
VMSYSYNNKHLIEQRNTLTMTKSQQQPQQ